MTISDLITNAINDIYKYASIYKDENENGKDRYVNFIYLKDVRQGLACCSSPVDQVQWCLRTNIWLNPIVFIMASNEGRFKRIRL